MVNMGKKIKEE